MSEKIETDKLKNETKNRMQESGGKGRKKE